MKKKALFASLAVLMAVVMVSVAFAASAGKYQTGSTTSTGAAINTSIGFQPSKVIVTRLSTTQANYAKAEWNASMSAASCILTTASSSTILATYTTTSCISQYTGSTTASPGFTIGTNASINPSSPADTLVYEAWY